MHPAPGERRKEGPLVFPPAVELPPLPPPYRLARQHPRDLLAAAARQVPVVRTSDLDPVPRRRSRRRCSVARRDAGLRPDAAFRGGGRPLPPPAPASRGRR